MTVPGRFRGLNRVEDPATAPCPCCEAEISVPEAFDGEVCPCEERSLLDLTRAARTSGAEPLIKEAEPR